MRLRMRRAVLALTLLGALALILAGCATPGSDGSAGTPGSPSTDGSAGDSLAASLAGRTFLSTAVDGYDLVAGSTIRLTFDDGQLKASAGCNTLTGDYRLTGDTVTVHSIGGTEMGCLQPLMEQDTWLAAFLGSSLQVDIDGDTLTLRGNNATVTLVDRRVADPDRPLQGTAWILDGVISGSGPSASVSSVPQGLTATLHIGDGKIHFFDGLNDYDGPLGPDAALTITPDTVHISGDIGGSAVGCASDNACSVDMSVLTHDFHYQISAARLTITGIGESADSGLMFVADEIGGAPPAGASSSAPVTDSPDRPASPGPVIPPGTATIPTSGATPGRSLPGGHDSIPPQPSPAVTSENPYDADSANETTESPLPGNRFRLTGMFTDAGGVDTKYPDAWMTITFRTHDAVADSSCGAVTYPDVRYFSDAAGPMVDLGQPHDSAGGAFECSFGSDPDIPPSGALMVRFDGPKLFLSTGLVGWYFEPVA